MSAPAPPPTRRWHFTRESRWWLLIVAVTIGVGVMKTINLLLLVGYMMLGLLGINAYVARSVARRVEAARVPLPPGFAGRPFVRSIDVTNTGHRAVEVSVTEYSAIHTGSFYLPSLAGGETRRIFVELASPARGRYRVSPLVADAGYPFGLLRYCRPLAEADELVVLPAIGTVDVGGLRRWLVRSGAGEANTRRPVHRQSSHHADVRGVRPYRPGDSPRDVHWRTTARRNILMVREYDSTEPLELMLVVDPWLPDRPAPTERAALEAALSLAASVFWSWCLSEEAPDVTLLVAGPGGGSRTGTAGEAFAREALGLLAGVEGYPDTRTFAAAPLRRRSSRCARVVVSSRPNTPLTGDLRSRTGVPFVPLDPSHPVAWYTPPQPPA